MFKNDFGTLTIDFSDQKSVLALNKAILIHHYKLADWNIPDGYLCPPIPSRADYIHHLNDVLKTETDSNSIKGLDIGTGANCIYPILGAQIYNWQMVGADINEVSIGSAKSNVAMNKLSHKIEIRHQNDNAHIFKNIIEPDEFYHFTMCNPANSAQKIRKHLIKSLIKSGQKRKDAEKIVSTSMKTPNFIEESMNTSLEEAFTKLRVCCYTTSNKNLLFWSHYADSHKGFCIEFRTDLAPISFAQKVEYTKTYPQVVYPIDNIGGRRMALVKSPDWSYEDEFRSLFIANSCTKMGIPHDGKSYIIPSSSIKNVYLGCQMSQESQDSLLSIIAKSDFTPKLWKASMAKDAFKLAFEAI